MIITRDTFEKFKDTYVRALAITLKECPTDCQKQKDDYLWNKLNELYQKPIDEEELDKLAKESMINYGSTCLSSFDNSDAELMMEGYYQGFKDSFCKIRE